MIAKHPDDVKKFLAAGSRAVAYFMAHKDEEVTVAAAVLHKPEAIVSRVYDEATPMITDNETGVSMRRASRPSANRLST